MISCPVFVNFIQNQRITMAFPLVQPQNRCGSTRGCVPDVVASAKIDKSNQGCLRGSTIKKCH